MITFFGCFFRRSWICSTQSGWWMRPQSARICSVLWLSLSLLVWSSLICCSHQLLLKKIKKLWASFATPRLFKCRPFISSTFSVMLSFSTVVMFFCVQYFSSAPSAHVLSLCTGLLDLSSELVVISQLQYGEILLLPDLQPDLGIPECRYH